MKTFIFNKASLCLNKRPLKFLVLFLFSFSIAISSYAHRVETYTTSGCFPGQAVTVDAVIVSAGGNTLYQWQFRDASGNWRCFINGTNATTINGVQFTVSGATGGPVANDAPLLTISRADGNTFPLDNVEVRVLMRDTPGPICAATPIGHTITGDTYGGDDGGQNETKYLRLHVYSYSGDCGGNTPGCIGNILTNGSGYYGGFENKVYNAGGDNYTDNNFIAGAGSSDFTASFAEPTADSYTAHSNTLTTNGRYLVANNPYYANFSYTRNIAPHTGNFQMVVNGSNSVTARAWFKSNITVVPGSTYSFCAWAARVNGDNPNIGLNITAGATTTEISNVDLTSVAIGTWTEVCGTYTVPAGVTSITISIRDKNAAGGANSYTLDDICFRLLGSIGNRVWNDTDKDGIQDAGEPGMAGVTVALFDANNSNLATTVTDANGNYLFTGLAVSAGGTNYQVRYSLPAEYKFSPQNSDAGGITSDNNSDADVSTGRTGNITLTTAVPNVSYADAGVNYANAARIGDFVWNDMDKDGIQDAGEPGMAGVSVMLYTSADVLIAATITANNGYYAFTDVPAGTYYIKIALPLGYQVSAKDQTADDKDSDIDPVTRKTANFAVVAGTFDLTFDAGLNVTPTTLGSASIGDRVWNDLNGNNVQDAGEPGIGDVTVQLFNSLNVLQGTLTTDPFGYYVFNGLTAGSYYVKFTLPSGFTFVTANVGDDDLDSDPATGTGQTGTYILITDQIRTNVDAGMKRSTSTAALGDFAWYDLDKDGVQDGGAEVGAPGITVILYNSSNAIVQTTTTDSKGFYLFTGLSASTAYTVGFSNLPAGYGFSPLSGAITSTTNSDVNPATGRTAAATTGAVGTTTAYVDAGLIITPNTFDSKGSIGDFVWNDLDNDGIQDASEPGVKGVTVTLYASNGTTVLATTITDALGYYIFTNVDAGSYVVGFSTLPAGYVFGTQNAAGSTGSNDSDPATGTGKTSPFTLKAGEVNTTIDAGVRNSTTGLLTIGDYVWYDVNGNGVQNTGEPGAKGVSVELLDVNSNTIATTTTNSKGFFLFTDLPAGTYYLQFNNLPAGFSATTKGAGTVSTNSDGNTASLRTDAISLAASDITWDLGIVSGTRAALGDYVWNDLNADGVQNANEPGIAGVTVSLFSAAGGVVATTVTDASGFYFFPNLAPATYTVGFSTIPANSGFTTKNSASATTSTDSDVNPATGKTDAVALSLGQVNTTVDAGIISLIAAVGNYVWRDANVNGIQDVSEKGAPGVSVYLYTSTDATIGNADDVAVASAVTDANGFYFINNIPVAAGGSQFYIRFTDLQANNVFTTFNAAGSNAANNSDVTTAPATGGRTGFFTLTPGSINLDIDAGLVGPDNATLPLHQLELRAVLSGTTVNLSWMAENEMETRDFVIQRSIDGINYSDIGTKLPTGPVNTPTEYKSVDNIQSLMSSPVIYYRIKAEDVNNKFAYSNIAPVKLSNLGGVEIWPNPFVSDIRISYYASAASSLNVRINDNAGRIVKQMNYAVSRGTNQLSVSGVEQLSPGIYYITVTDNNTNQSFVQKLTK